MIDTSKQYRCRNGCEWRYIETKDDKIIGAVKNQHGSWAILEWDLNGSYPRSFCNDMDLVEAGLRIKREYWISIYDTYDVLSTSEQQAKKYNQHRKPDACVKVVIDCEEGEGL